MAMSGLQIHDLDLLHRILKELEQKEVQADVVRQETAEPSFTPQRRKCISRGNSGHQADAETQLPSTPWSTTTSPCSSLPPELRERPAPRVPLQLDSALHFRPPPGLPDPSQAPHWEWTIMNPNAKFKGNCGCPLVSPPFSAGGLVDCRVIFTPGECWANAQPKDAKKMKKKEEKTKVWPRPPRFGSLQLKCGEQSVRNALVFFHVGSACLGPVRASAEHSTSQVCELTHDWRSMLDQLKGSLTLRVEVA